ncbi:I78 family peptidase inhibitor [Variovorax sp. CCNWLW235]|uniref:I78 family peptidase inhibitor n=1 Tax=Variovorax sp. CCNWLW235 TaxID=3127463 RepID=UPI0030784ACB
MPMPQQTGFISSSRARGAMAAALCAAMLFIAGCQAQPEFRPLTSEAPPPPSFVTVPAEEACQAAQARYALGRPLTPPLLEEMRTRTGSKSARTSAAGTPLLVPADPARLNVDLDPQGLVVAARCG